MKGIHAEVQLSLFVNDMILCIGESKDSTKRPNRHNSDKVASVGALVLTA